MLYFTTFARESTKTCPPTPSETFYFARTASELHLLAGGMWSKPGCAITVEYTLKYKNIFPVPFHILH